MNAFKITALILIFLMMTAQLPAFLIPTISHEDNTRERASNEWRMFGGDFRHTSNGGYFSRNLTKPFIVWDINTTYETIGTCIGDFGKNIELNNTSTYPQKSLHVVSSSAGRLVIYDGISGKNMWQVQIPGGMRATPLITDLNGNGKKEIVSLSLAGVLYNYEPRIIFNGTDYEINPNATIEDLRWNTTFEGNTELTSLNAYDITGDDKEEIFFTVGNKIYCVNGATGKEMWNLSLKGTIATSPLILNYSKESKRICVISYNRTALTLNKEYIYLLNKNGTEIWSKAYDLSVLITVWTVMPSPSACDINSDGIDEIVALLPFVDGKGRLILFYQNGSYAWEPKNLPGQAEASPSIGDVNGDGKDEIIVTSWDYNLTRSARTHVQAYKGSDGSLLWKKTIDDSVDLLTERCPSTSIVMDINNDKCQDVISYLSNGFMYGLSGKNGSMLWRIDTHRLGAYNSPSSLDIDFDHFPDIICNGIRLTQKVPDFCIFPGDITFSNNTPSEGDTIEITSIIRNNGTGDGKNVTVIFYDIYDKKREIEKKTTDINASSTKGVSVMWNVSGGGVHTIEVVVDPYDEYEEKNESNNRASMKIEVFSHYTILLTCENNETYIDPGEPANYVVKVWNKGDKYNTIEMSVEDVPEDWYVSMTKDSFTLSPNESTIVGVSIATSKSSQAGPYPVRLLATSKTAPTNKGFITLTTYIKGKYGVLLTPSVLYLNVTSDNIVEGRITLENVGNSHDTIIIANTSPPEGWWCVIDPTSVELDGGDKKNITFMIRPPPTAEEGSEASVKVTATSQGDKTKISTCTVITRVVLPDLVVKNYKLFRYDGQEVDGITKHLIANRLSTINVTVYNALHNVDVGGIDVVLREGDIELSDARIDILKAEEEKNVSMRWGGDEGYHILEVIVDDENVVKERNEDNNNLTFKVYLKSPSDVGPFIIHGKVMKNDGSPISNADVIIKNERTEDKIVIKTDDSGKYSYDVYNLPNKYYEEDLINVTASDGIVEKSYTFYIYSEDKEKEINFILEPGPYDFYLTPKTTLSTVKPGDTTSFEIIIYNLGTENNTIIFNISHKNAFWSAKMSDGIKNITLVTVSPMDTESVYLMVTAPKDALADEHEHVTLEAYSANESKRRHILEFDIYALQVYGISLTYEIKHAPKPGESLLATINVMNSGNGNDTIELNITNISKFKNVTLNPNKVNLSAGKSSQCSLSLDVPTTIKPGNYTLYILAKSSSNLEITENFTFEVKSFIYGVRVIGKSGTIQENDVCSLEVVIKNIGNCDDTYILDVKIVHPQKLPKNWKEPKLLKNNLPIQSASIPAGGEEKITFEIEPPEEIENILEIATMEFNISAYSQTKPDIWASGSIIISIMRPDITFSGSIKFSDSNPTEGEEIEIAVEIENQGTWIGENFHVVFYRGSNIIGKKKIESLDMRESITVSVKWNAVKGEHVITVIINPDKEIKELLYRNNEMSTRIVIKEKKDAGIGVILLILIVLLGIGTYLYIYYSKTGTLPFVKKKKRKKYSLKKVKKKGRINKKMKKSRSKGPTKRRVIKKEKKGGEKEYGEDVMPPIMRFG